MFSRRQQQPRHKKPTFDNSCWAGACFSNAAPDWSQWSDGETNPEPKVLVTKKKIIFQTKWGGGLNLWPLTSTDQSRAPIGCLSLAKQTRKKKQTNKQTANQPQQKRVPTMSFPFFFWFFFSFTADAPQLLQQRGVGPLGSPAGALRSANPGQSPLGMQNPTH